MVQQGTPLFPRIDLTKTGETATRGSERGEALSGSASGGGQREPPIVDIKDFQKMVLKVAVVTAAEAVAGADKLLKLQVDLGGETRQIVAGIAQHYAPDTLVGKRVIVVTNLKPAKIRGVESQGMLLAASTEDQLTLVVPEQELPPGAKVR